MQSRLNTVQSRSLAVTVDVANNTVSYIIAMSSDFKLQTNNRILFADLLIIIISPWDEWQFNPGTVYPLHGHCYIAYPEILGLK
jgi:hypothetical protein